MGNLLDQLNARLTAKKQSALTALDLVAKAAEDYALVHKYGVKGMKRGVRKPKETTGNTQSPQGQPSVAESYGSDQGYTKEMAGNDSVHTKAVTGKHSGMDAMLVGAKFHRHLLANGFKQQGPAESDGNVSTTKWNHPDGTHITSVINQKPGGDSNGHTFSVGKEPKPAEESYSKEDFAKAHELSKSATNMSNFVADSPFKGNARAAMHSAAAQAHTEAANAFLNLKGTDAEKKQFGALSDKHIEMADKHKASAEGTSENTPAAKPEAQKPAEATPSSENKPGYSEENLKKFVDGLHAKNAEYQKQMGGHNAYKTHYSVEHGKRYAKIVATSADLKTGEPNPDAGRSVHSFIDKTNGNVLKANSWKAPHPIPRGNIGNADHGLNGVGVHGANYLK